MITLYHLEKSRSFRIVWLLEELKLAYGLDYDLISFNRDNKTYLAPKELKAIHPMGKAPILVDDSLSVGEQALAESALIIEHLLKTYDHEKKFYPADDKAWRDYTFWMHFAEGSLMPPLVMGLILSKACEKSPFFAKPIARKLKDGIGKMILNNNVSSALELIEQSLAQSPWFAGSEFTGADVQMYFAVAAARERTVLPPAMTATRAWLDRCESRAGFIKTVEKVGTVF
ncbi:glutathione S-transferase [Moraxella sp. FZLJ2107]|uniref:glutathione S-transferase n=1 Tax=unclassified Moraxella TaxID=2685852 RepID=UPI0020C8A1D1|nr:MULTISPECIES: glutathione S-transferase [unclassified Moraxella]UTO04886.1 glutathione S-transferase [Moraxella sp. FZLJ2107]UTO21620.1 glutathione S-transferase [Moraxella sp. FZLJ2109]